MTENRVKHGEAPGLERGNFTTFAFDALGTRCRVTCDVSSSARADRFARDVQAWMRDYEQRYSRFRDDSVISAINREAGVRAVPIDDELRSLFTLCDWFHWLSGGIFDPTALPLTRLWDYHNPAPVMPTEEQVQTARRLTGWKRVVRDRDTAFLPEPGMAIDLGGIGKEYAVDRVVEMALDRGMTRILVDFGQDIRVHGTPPEGGPWRIGLEDPADPGHCPLGVALRDKAVATSGDYVRHVVLAGKRFGHVVDTRTGYPVDNACRSVSVIAPTCTEAGILAKTVFILGPDEGLAFLERCPQAQACVRTEQRQYESRRFADYVIPRAKTA